MTPQTAVEFLIEEIHKNMGVWIPLHIQEQAKEMEKEQIDESFKEGYKNGVLTEKWEQTYGGDK